MISMTLNINDYPCKCGHEKERHRTFETTDFCCLGCWFEGLADRDNGLDTLGESFHNFTPDNLKYLEEKYNQQILDKYRSIK